MNREELMMRRLLALMLLLIIPVCAAGEQSGRNQTEYRIPASIGNLYGVLQMPEGEGPVPLVITWRRRAVEQQ